MGAPRRTDHVAPPGASLVPGAGIQTVGEGLQGAILIARLIARRARAPPGRFQTFGRTTRRVEYSYILLRAGAFGLRPLSLASSQEGYI